LLSACSTCAPRSIAHSPAAEIFEHRDHEEIAELFRRVVFVSVVPNRENRSFLRLRPGLSFQFRLHSTKPMLTDGAAVMRGFRKISQRVNARCFRGAQLSKRSGKAKAKRPFRLRNRKFA